jgi:hypothetical protein
MTAPLEQEYQAIRASLDDVGMKRVLDELRADYAESHPARFAEHLRVFREVLARRAALPASRGRSRRWRA